MKFVPQLCAFLLSILVLAPTAALAVDDVPLAQAQAMIAAAVKLPTHVLATVTQTGQSLYGINTTNNGRVVVFGGGYPVKAGAQTIGGIGVSGGSVEQDMEVAQAGLAALKR